MNLEVGQYINDGQYDLLVSAIDSFENKQYVYVINEEKDEALFYEMKRENDGWNFYLENSPHQIHQLILHFAKKVNVDGVIDE